MFQFSGDMPKQYRRCDHCIFWKRIVRFDPLGSVGSSGECRIRSPKCYHIATRFDTKDKALDYRPIFQFPITREKDWCGEGQFMDMEDCNERQVGGNDEKFNADTLFAPHKELGKDEVC